MTGESISFMDYCDAVVEGLLKLFGIDTTDAAIEPDSRAIFTAAAHAQRAVDYLRKLQPERMEAAA